MARSLWLVCLTLITLLSSARLAIAADDTQWITAVDDNGDQIYLADNRKPSLYTGNFGDCLGDSLVNVTRFDAAYYQDNMTVLFHLAGTTALANESLMMYIGVFAYGESRFDLTFNPCSANIDSLCPMNRSVPIEANGIIPVGQNDVANVPTIAFSIPDFEGEAILRIFANSTQSEIGCYSAVVTNGNTFSQPAPVGTILGIFTLVAVIASFATAIYGDSVPVMRTHYAHSMSVMVVFSVFQHIFFTGALSMNWPSVLVAWWSNFAWAGGMIFTDTMQSSINHLIGNNVGNTSQVGAAASGTLNENLGGGYDISAIYKRASIFKRGYSHLLKRDIASELYQRHPADLLKRDIVGRQLEQALSRRDLPTGSQGYNYYGSPVGAGIPLPGNYSGFSGTLAQEGIRASNAFMTGLLWFLILLVLMAGAVVAFKWSLEGLVRWKRIRSDRLTFFRQNWTLYTANVALRTTYIAFFMMMFLTMFQFSYDSSVGAKAIAALVFVVFFLGTVYCIFYAYWYRIQEATSGSRSQETQQPQRLQRVSASLKTLLPQRQEGESKKASWQTAMHRISDMGRYPQPIHEDEFYVRRFGWLAARFRRSRWWFFGVWTLYEFVRACFYGGASGHPMTQVFGLLVVEILAFAFIVWVRPFEGRRLNILVVYLLGFSKVATVALSAAFDISFNLPRITTTAIGIIIIVIQGFLTIVTMVAIVVGAISSYMSLTRNHEEFKPRKWAGYREKYFIHIDRVAHELPRPAPPPVEVPEEPKGPYFNVASVRRLNKIEDDDPDFSAEMRSNYAASAISLRNPTPTHSKPMTPVGDLSGATITPARSRAASMNSVRRGSLPFGARSARPSWSSRDFGEDGSRNADTINMNQHVPDDVSIPPVPPLTGEYARPTSSLTSTPSRSATLPVQRIRPTVSNDSLRVGGDKANHDGIDSVPTPRSRPRSGTFGAAVSRGPSQSGTPTQSIYYTADGDLMTAGPDYNGAAGEAPRVHGERRKSKSAVLPPALEGDEDISGVNSSRKD